MGNLKFTIDDTCVKCGACAEDCPVQCITEGMTRFNIGTSILLDHCYITDIYVFSRYYQLKVFIFNWWYLKYRHILSNRSELKLFSLI